MSSTLSAMSGAPYGACTLSGLSSGRGDEVNQLGRMPRRACGIALTVLEIRYPDEPIAERTVTANLSTRAVLLEPISGATWKAKSLGRRQCSMRAGNRYLF